MARKNSVPAKPAVKVRVKRPATTTKAARPPRVVRQLTRFQTRLERMAARAIVLKNHWTETAGLATLIRKYGTQGIEVFGSVTLDAPVGGVNPMAVRYMADVEGTWGRIVWMPTHDSEHEVTYNKAARLFVRVSRDGQLLPEVLEVLSLIAQHDLTLARIEQVSAAHHARDALVGIVHHHRELIGEQAVGTAQDEIAHVARHVLG